MATIRRVMGIRVTSLRSIAPDFGRANFVDSVDHRDSSGPPEENAPSAIRIQQGLHRSPDRSSPSGSAGLVTVSAQTLPRKWGEVTWARISSDTGELEVPFGGAAQQTDAQILDIDNDGVNDFVLVNRNVPPAVVWYRSDGTGWTRHVVEAVVVAARGRRREP